MFSQCATNLWKAKNVSFCIACRKGYVEVIQKDLFYHKDANSVDEL